MERIDLNKPINRFDNDVVIPRPISTRKVKRIISKAAKNKSGINAASPKPSTDSKVGDKKVDKKDS